MPIRVLDASQAEQFRSRINGDPEFKLVSRDMTLNLAIEVGVERRLVKIRDGQLFSIGTLVAPSEPVDITITATDEFWQKLVLPVPPPRFQNLYAGVRFATCKVSGNSELYNAYYAALTRMIEALREFENG